MVVGFYVHTDMDFVVTERRSIADEEHAPTERLPKTEVAALPGAYDE